MSLALLETMKQQVNALPKQQQAELAQFLLKQMKQDAVEAAEQSVPPGEVAAAEPKPLRQLEWLIAHREEYAGQYVALDGDRLVGQGRTIVEARAQARLNGIEQPFLMRLTSEHEVLPGGW